MINPTEITATLKANKRTERNFALRDSDVYMIVDFPINNYQRDLIKTYRQSLRDYFQNPDVINWTFTLENQELPPLPSFPDFAEASASASLKFIDVPMEVPQEIPMEVPQEIPMEVDINSSNIYN